MTVFSRASTRREFLTTTSLAVAGTVLGARTLQAGEPVVIPANSPLPADSFLSIMSVSELQRLAIRAMDAAKSAGAHYADVRISEQHSLRPELERVFMQTKLTFGVRALVDGVWGFAYGRAPTADALTRCAEDAVSAARLSAKLNASKEPASSAEWISAPVVTGEWRMPIQVDPFTVPVQQHAELMAAIAWTINSIPGAELFGTRTEWWKETRVVATTTGSLVTQHQYLADLQINPIVQYGSSQVTVRVPGIQCMPGGYETISTPDIQDRFKAAVEEVAWLAHLPVRPLDVGRYPVVFDGYVMGNLLTRVIGPSLELDRVLGHDIDASGTSRWSLDLLGTQVAGPGMTVSGHRAMPSVNAVQWDDEGSVPQEHTVIRDGVLVDYHTNAQTVPALRSWYERQGKPLRSNGCAVAAEADKIVSIRPPHLAMKPSTSGMLLGDLYKDMNRGIVALNNGWVSTDQQLSSGSINSWSMLFEVSRGKIVRRLKDVAIQFNTIPFLKGITAIGDQRTVCYRSSRLNKGMPWQTTQQSATAPAVLFKEVNAISAGRL